MNRRSLLAWLGFAPAAGIAAKLAIPAVAQAAPTSVIPLGHMVDVATSDTFPVSKGSGCNTWGLVSIFKKKIYDGERYVDFDSPEGTGVFNKLIAQRSRNRDGK